MKKVLKECQWVLLALFTICIYSCKDDDNTGGGDFDPSKPIVVSEFTPKEGGAYQKLLISGENFGTDASNVKVTIGGKQVVVINVKKAIQLIDLEKRYLSSPLSNLTDIPTGRIRSLDFNKKIEGYADEAEYMIVSVDFDGKGDESTSVFLIKRNADGTFNDNSNIQLVAAYKQCNGASIHPII